MSTNYCPKCDAELAREAINIAEGVALCAICGYLSRLSEVVSRSRPITEILSRPPKGCVASQRDQSIVVRASLRSPENCLLALFFALFWNGIVSLFVLTVGAELYANLVGPLPHWFPAPVNEPPMSMGMILFLCLFLLPFVMIGLLMMGAVIVYAAGKTEVFIDENAGVVRTGVGFFVWRRRFDPALVRRVRMGTTAWRTDGQPNPVVVIEADRTIKFGLLLQDDRREWLQAILHTLLTTKEWKVDGGVA